MDREPEARSPEALAALLSPVLRQVRDAATVADHFVDKDVFRLSLATLWANLVMNPGELGFEEPELEALYNLLSAETAAVLGPEQDLKACFAFINSKPGERAMGQARLGQSHRDMLSYFASMMLDPEGHRRWMDELREDLSSP